MIERQPYLPRFMAGGDGNPLGAHALYLGNTLYRIHGTNQPSTIGSFVSSGCIRLTNEDITDLYRRVRVGTRVVVLSGKQPVAVTAPVGSSKGMSSPARADAASASDIPMKKRKMPIEQEQESSNSSAQSEVSAGRDNARVTDVRRNRPASRSSCARLRLTLRSGSTRFMLLISENGRCRMTWTTPILVEICIGLEINGYLPAEF
jgi:coenzyme PQQ precursor peptide PqqA